jgi:hypothetical protein
MSGTNRATDGTGSHPYRKSTEGHSATIPQAKEVGWRFWLPWTLLCAASYIVAAKLFLETFHNISGVNWVAATVQMCGIFVSLGLVTGGAQWLVLRPYGFSPWWIGATIAGSVIVPIPPLNMLGNALCQTFILWRRVRWSGLWFFAHIPNVLLIEYSWNVLYRFPALTRGLTTRQETFIVFIMAAIVSALVTAATLTWLLRQPKAENAAADT